MSDVGWRVEHHTATVGTLHGLGMPADPVRMIRVCRPTDRALVLGSAQKDSDIDHEAVGRHGLEIVRRISGGSAVLVEPGTALWIDVIVPKHDSLWSDDVGRAFHWLGRAWVEALRQVGTTDAALHEGAMVNTLWSRRICFAGMGPGEVAIDGKKVIGISQRRTRAGALFQCSALRSFDPQRLVSLFRMEPDEAEATMAALGNFVGVFDFDDAKLIRAFTAALAELP